MRGGGSFGKKGVKERPLVPQVLDGKTQKANSQDQRRQDVSQDARLKQTTPPLLGCLGRLAADSDVGAFRAAERRQDPYALLL